MKTTLFLFILTWNTMQIASCQTNIINYMTSSKDSYTINTKECSKDGDKVISSKTIEKDTLTFRFKEFVIYHNPDNPSKFNGDIQLEIDKSINKSLMPKINYTTYFYLIISKDGEIISTGIRNPSGQGCSYDKQLIDVICNLKGWVAASHKEETVPSLLYIKYIYTLH